MTYVKPLTTALSALALVGAGFAYAQSTYESSPPTSSDPATTQSTTTSPADTGTMPADSSASPADTSAMPSHPALDEATSEREPKADRN